ncbi:unnamed protein product [Clonostachys chloroleuca]|uniref:Uncharacterized protein n=1 Tax=Clonostachys chloroleuca TaxID=1926264 RepID=A0AA35M2H8_9HYPO|nr:unnamed protein product [Clonostachys chloroleuca]
MFCHEFGNCIILYDSIGILRMLTDDYVTKSDVSVDTSKLQTRNPTTNTNQQDDLNRMITAQHIFSHSRGGSVALLPSRESSYNDVELSDTAQNIRIVIVFRGILSCRVAMYFVQHGP